MPHARISLRAVALELDVTPPALIKYLGSTTGYLAALAAMQWARLEIALNEAGEDRQALALSYVMWAFDNPHRFRLLYEPTLWASQTESTAVGRSEERRKQTTREVKGMAKARNACFGYFVGAEVQAGGSKDRVDLRAKFLTSLATGLALEFVNERLYSEERDEVVRRGICEALAKKIFGEAVKG